VGILSLLVFTGDGYLKVKEEVETRKERKAQKFFRIASRLPFDFQMDLCCHLQPGCPRGFFSSVQIEWGLNYVLQNLL